ncbi:response regulator [bacterium]|nr:MAG: response regulator [bacterium]
MSFGMNNKPNILLVDDFQSQRNITKLTLQSLNLNVNYLEAGNGQEALEIMKTELIAGVITDYEMPVMNGMEMIKEMRKSTRLLNVPVIMITSIKGSEPEAYANGITYWLLKPYVQNDLRNAIQTHFPKEIQGKTFKILLVDDVEMQTSIWEKLLSMPHFEFTKANSAREAWNYLKNGGFDALITDYLMPDVDGMRLIKKVKSTMEYRNLPIFVISQDESAAELASEFGVEGVFSKPFNPAIVKNTLRESLMK